MSLDKIVAGLDLTKIKAPSGLTYAQELVRAANLLRDCIQSRINRGSMGSCLSTADIADIKVDGSASWVLRLKEHATIPSKGTFIKDSKNEKSLVVSSSSRALSYADDFSSCGNHGAERTALAGQVGATA